MILHSNWNIDIITDWDELYSDSFQAKWLKYLESSVNSHVFFHPSLCMAWIETYLPFRKITPFFCVMESGDGNIFLPLVLWKQNWKNAFRRIIVPVGFSDFDYHDPLASIKLSVEEWNSFFTALTNKLITYPDWDEIFIDGLRDQDSLLKVVSSNSEALYCDLSVFSDSSDLLNSLKSSLRGDLLRQIRKIERRGKLSVEKFDTIETAIEHLPHFLKFHSARWPDAYKAPLLHQNIITRGIESGIADFSALKSGDDYMSYNLGFTFRNVYYYYMPVIDPIYENFSPGKVHLYHLITDLIGKRIGEFDFLRGSEKYKSDWCRSEERRVGKECMSRWLPDQ